MARRYYNQFNFNCFIIKSYWQFANAIFTAGLYIIQNNIISTGASLVVFHCHYLFIFIFRFNTEYRFDLAALVIEMCGVRHSNFLKLDFCQGRHLVLLVCFHCLFSIGATTNIKSLGLRVSCDRYAVDSIEVKIAVCIHHFHSCLGLC